MKTKPKTASAKVKTPTKKVVKSVTKASSKAVTKPAAKKEAKPVAKLAAKAVTKPVTKTVTKAVTKPVVVNKKSATKPTLKTPTKTMSKTATKATTKAAEKTTKPAQKTTLGLPAVSTAPVQAINEGAQMTQSNQTAEDAGASQPITGRGVFAVRTLGAAVSVEAAFLAEDGNVLRLPAVFPNRQYAIEQIDELRALVNRHFDELDQGGI
jgi:hypothetical protein